MTTPPTHAEAGETGTDEFVGWIISTSDHTGFRTDIRAGGYDLIADEPVSVGGSGAGPSPYDYMLAAIGSCTAMTVRMYAGRKQWPLERITVRVRNTPAHIRDSLDCEISDVGPRRVDRVIEIVGQLTDEQRTRLLYIADRCPVKQTLQRGIQIRTVESTQ